ncbi:MAG: BamA/TamA family outer membrane protein, partial [bacterium]|nr:BamA/TamA family outer membrane protein [bacterium]
DIVIAIDVATTLRSQKNQIQNLFDIFDQALSFRIEEKKIQNRKLADVLIMPDLEDFSASNFDQALTLIPLGRTATEAHLETIRQKLIDHGLTSEHTAPRSPRLNADLTNLDEFIYAPGQIQIDSIRIQGLNRYPEAAIRNRLQAQSPTSISTLDRDVAILYATGFFDTVTYQLSWESGQTILTFKVQEAIPAEIGLGLHYNLDFQLLGLVEVARPHLFNPGSILFLRGILGKIKYAELDLNLNLLGNFRWATGVHSHTRKRLVFTGESQTGSYRQTRYGFSSALQHLFQNWGRLETGYQTEKVTVEDVTGSTPEQVSGTLSGLRAQATVDLLDDADFPTSGLALKTRLDWIFRSSISNVKYRRYLAALNYHISTPSGLTLSLNGNWGLVDGKSPFYEHLHTGGTGSFQFSSARFPGLTREEIRSTHRLILGATLRKRLQKFIFGNTQDISFALFYHLGLFNRTPGVFALKDRVHSLGLGFYANTQIPGPIRLELGATDRRDIHIHLSFGYAF